MKISAGDLPSAESILEVHRARKARTASTSWASRGSPGARRSSGTGRRRRGMRSRPASSRSRGSALRRTGTTRRRRTTPSAPRSRSRPRKWSPRERRRKRSGSSSERAGPGEGALQPARADPEAPQPDRARRPDGSRHPRGGPGRAGVPRPRVAARKAGGALFWWDACGDCKAQAAALKRPSRNTGRRASPSSRRHASTRDRAVEKTKIEKAWKRDLRPAGVRGRSHQRRGDGRYGVSATPTFVFVDRKGVVPLYRPTG